MSVTIELSQNLIYADYFGAMRKICPEISDDMLNYYEQTLTITHLNTKEFYISKGDIQQNAGYIYSGLIRSFYINENGNEVNVVFLKEQNHAVDYDSFRFQIPSKYYFQCIEPTILINVPFDTIRDSCNKFHSFDRYLRILLENELHFKQQRIDSFIFDNAKTRYMNFISGNEDLFRRLTLSQLSSYLGIERQTLTRIRKELLNK